MNLHLKKPVPIFVADESSSVNGYLIGICEGSENTHILVVIPEEVKGSRRAYNSNDYISSVKLFIEENPCHISSNEYIVFNTSRDPVVVILEENEHIELLILSLKTEELCKQA